MADYIHTHPYVLLVDRSYCVCVRRTQKLGEGDEEWHAKRDELKSLLRGGPQNAWLKGEASPAVGLGSVKFADLSMTRTNDYRFSYKKMVDFQVRTRRVQMIHT